MWYTQAYRMGTCPSHTKMWYAFLKKTIDIIEIHMQNSLHLNTSFWLFKHQLIYIYIYLEVNNYEIYFKTMA